MKKLESLALAVLLLTGCTTAKTIPEAAPVSTETPEVTPTPTPEPTTDPAEEKSAFYSAYPMSLIAQFEEAAVKVTASSQNTTVLAGHIDKDTFVITVCSDDTDFAFYLNGNTVYLSGDNDGTPYSGKLDLGLFGTAVSSLTDIQLIDEEELLNAIDALEYKETRNGYDLCTTTYREEQYRLYFNEEDHRLMYMENMNDSVTFEIIYSGLSIPEELKNAETLDLSIVIEQISKLSEQLNSLMQ